MSVRQTQVECDSCGSDQFVVFMGDPRDDGPEIVYIECDGCGMSVMTLRAET